MRVARKFIWLNAARLAIISLVLVAVQIVIPGGGAKAVTTPTEGFRFGVEVVEAQNADPNTALNSNANDGGLLLMSNGLLPGLDVDSQRRKFTVESWVKSDNYAAANAVVLLGAYETWPGDNTMDNSLSIYSNGKTSWHVDAAGWATMQFATPTLTDSQWHHVVVAGDGNGIRIWIDGQKHLSVSGCSGSLCESGASGNLKFSAGGVTRASKVVGGWGGASGKYSNGAVFSSYRLSDVARYDTTATTISVSREPLTAVDLNTKLLLNNPVIGTTAEDSSNSQTLTISSIRNKVAYTSQNPNELVTFDKQNNSSASTSAVARNSFATATDPTWYGYNFKGWAETSTGVVRNLSTVAITGEKTFYGIWEQKSLAGAGTLPTPNTLSPHPTNDQLVSTSRGTTSTSVKVPAGALPSTYSVKVYTLPDNDLATQTLGANNTYIISQIVAWSDTAIGSVGNIQDTAAGKPIEMTITSPDIKIGAKVYSLLGNVSTLLATATQDGSVVATFSVDPVIVVQAAPVVISSGGGYSAPLVSPTPTATTTPVKTVAKSFSVFGFNPGSWKLTKSIKKSIDTFFKSFAKPAKISCIGYTMGPTVLRGDYNLAMRRGQEVCKYVVAKNPTIAKVSTKGTTTKISNSKYRKATLNLTY